MKKSTPPFLTLLIVLVTLTACNLPNGTTPPSSDQEATSVAQTVQALNQQQENKSPTYTPTTQTTNTTGEIPSNTPNASPTNTQNAPTNQPAATQKPTATKQPTAAPQSVPLTLGTISQILAEIGYGNCSAEPSILSANITVEPQSEVSSVRLWYEINSQGGSWGPYSKAMSYAQIGEYFAEIDMNVEGPGTLVDTGGWVTYWVEAIAKDGTSYTSAYYSMNVIYCPQGVLGPPATLPFVNYFTGPLNANAGDQVTLYWEVFDAACGVYLDGAPVQETGSYTYTLPLQGNPSELSHLLEAQGEPCNNPNIVIETVLIQISQP